MSLQVEAIKFNHDSTSATHDALNIRVDATNFVNVPEWQHGVSVTYADSPAAYAIQQVGKNIITIQARFAAIPPPFGIPLNAAVEIRAVTVGLKFPPWPFPPPNPLGDVAAQKVVFNAKGQSGWVTFNVTGHLGSTVRVSNITWEWQYLHPLTHVWTNFGQTKHRIYVLLDTPTAPWQQTPNASTNTQLPWTAVLDFACAWAHGAITTDAAAGLITDHVYALGPGTITYDCPGGGGSHYSAGTFNCTKFLERLHGGFGNGQYVNCSDCATITSSFANILGCDLSQSMMGHWFDLKPLLAIGSNTWQTACGWPQFYYHEVAWKAPCGTTENIFDACLEVNTNAAPPPYAGVLPKNMPFNTYRPLLSSGGNCNPIGPCTRRSIV